MNTTVLPAQTSRQRRWSRWVGLVFGLGVLALLGWAASKVDWPAVWQAVRELPPTALLAALGLAAVSHLVCASYDLFGKAWTKHGLPWGRVMPITFVSYAFNLSLGSVVGAFAIRFRLYSRLGLRNEQISRVLALTLTTNWMGYGVLAGGVFLMGWLTPPEDWPLNAGTLRWLGAGLWLVVAVYLGLCAWAGQRSFSVRGHRFNMPTLPMAGLQLLLSSLNWMTMAGVIWLLLQQEVPYPMVLTALLAAAMAGVATHVPAGLGVLEAVFVAILASAAPHAGVLAALLAYRAIYYLLPLLAATALYFTLEARWAKATEDERPLVSGAPQNENPL